MEKVKVVKTIPGMLKKGDILVSPVAGADFVLDETDVTVNGVSERFVSMDYVTVCENIPRIFELVLDEVDAECYFCGSCSDCGCTTTEEELADLDIELGPNAIVKTEEEIQARYEFFKEKFQNSYPNTEAQVVYKNLMWFIEWLQGKAQLI